ncbi:MAG: Hsp20/alpha crystallin family protein [Acidobacteria bacterium]|nr:Hsp20/alpha crystallin family protein [Acidobacteriota bacterium]
MFPDISDFASDIRRAFDDLDRQFAGRGAGEYVPPVDVFETPDGVTIVVDVPGVPAASVRAVMKNGVVIVIGEKPGAPCGCDHAQFHVAERSFGRFARGIRLHGAFDAARAAATLAGGELRITVPRLEDRRGKEIVIPIQAQ